jgi:hypothetical protein
MSDTESNSSASSVESPKESKKSNLPVLKENVTAYIKIDDLIKEKQDEIKELKEKKLKYEDYIKSYLEKEKKEKITLDDGEIVYKKVSTKQPIKEEIIQKAIISKIKDIDVKKIDVNQIAQNIIQELDNMRGVSIKNNIKRVGRKKKKN